MFLLLQSLRREAITLGITSHSATRAIQGKVVNFGLLTEQFPRIQAIVVKLDPLL